MQNRTKFHFDNIYTPEQMAVGPYIVHQIGDLCCEPGYVVPAHRQWVHEISYVVSGSGRFFSNGEWFDAHRGALIVNSLGDTHRIEASTEEPLRYMYLGFKMQTPIASDAIRTLDSFYQSPRVWARPDMFDVQDTFVRLLTETIINDGFSPLLKECCINELLCQVYRLMNPKGKNTYHMGEGNRTDTQRLVYDIAHYIDSNIGKLNNLLDLSREFGYSYTYLARIFSNQMGETLNSYYTRHRFEKAQEYLQNGVSITNVAELLGYQSIHTFSRAFKRQIGVCPRDSLTQQEGETLPAAHRGINA